MPEQFSSLVHGARKVLITSHISPDLDAVASSLLLAETLRANISGPEFRQVLEERPAGNLSFLHNFQTIEFAPILATLESYQPDLLIITDANNYGRISRNESDKVRDWVTKNRTKVIVIDHHEEVNKDEVVLFLNEHGPAAVQEVYRLCFVKLGMKKPEGYGDTTMLGILGDTGRFKYDNPTHRETFSIVSDLLDSGVIIEQIDDRLQRYTPLQLRVIAELMNNVSSEGNYTYSFIRDEFRDKWNADNLPAEDFKLACNMFIDQYIRNIDDRWWGFIVYPDLSNPHNYSASFRASTGSQDVSIIANVLGGGGHKPAAGAKFAADTMQTAVQKVQDAIKQVR